MIRVVSSQAGENSIRYITSFAALRHRIFIERLGWDVGAGMASIGLECDRFDTEEAIYILVCNQNDTVIAGVRLLKTTGPFVLSECFPGLADEAIAGSEKILEVTRFVVDPDAARQSGMHALNAQLVWALQSYGLMAGLSSFVSVSYAGMERLLASLGCRIRRLGSPRVMDGRRVVALSFEIADDILANVQARLFGLTLQADYTVPQTHQAPPETPVFLADRMVRSSLPRGNGRIAAS